MDRTRPQVEVRLITYRRPRFLQRALSSLLQQTHENWRAIVYDDSPDEEGRAVINALGDSRICYSLNPCNLGMVKNTSQAFAARHCFQGSAYACVLEDDNEYDPAFLEANISAIADAGKSVLARNYRVRDITDDGEMRPTNRMPMQELWGSEPRAIPFDARIQEAFFSFTLGNLGYFWDLNAGLDLSSSHEPCHGPVSETSRAVAFESDCWFEPEPLSVFSRFVNKRQTPRSEAPGTVRSRFISKVSEIQFSRRLMNTWRHHLGRPISVILRMADDRPEGPDALRRLAEAGCWQAMVKMRGSRWWWSVLKCQLVRAAYYRTWAAKSRNSRCSDTPSDAGVGGCHLTL